MCVGGCKKGALKVRQIHCRDGKKEESSKRLTTCVEDPADAEAMMPVCIVVRLIRIICGCPQAGRRRADWVNSGPGSMQAWSFAHLCLQDNNYSSGSYHFVECWLGARSPVYYIANSQDGATKPLSILPFTQGNSGRKEVM